MILNNILDAIGKTPVVKLNRVGTELDCTLYVKCEFMNAEHLALVILQRQQKISR